MASPSIERFVLSSWSNGFRSSSGRSGGTGQSADYSPTEPIGEAVIQRSSIAALVVAERPAGEARAAEFLLRFGLWRRHVAKNLFRLERPSNATPAYGPAPR